MNTNEYIFFFLGGSGGSFVKSIFAYYLSKIDSNLLKSPILKVSDDGSCHTILCNLPHTHWLEDIDTSKKIVLIDFDDDDLPTMTRMAFDKVVVNQIACNQTFLTDRWGSKFNGVSDHQEMIKIFIENPTFLFFEDWKEMKTKINPVLTVKFKEVLFSNLNKKIADFFSVDPYPEIDEFIYDYRNINKKFIDYQGNFVS